MKRHWKAYEEECERINRINRINAKMQKRRR